MSSAYVESKWFSFSAFVAGSLGGIWCVLLVRVLYVVGEIIKKVRVPAMCYFCDSVLGDLIGGWQLDDGRTNQKLGSFNLSIGCVVLLVSPFEVISCE